ncbi:MAG: hypothetical protein QM496_03845 [Verrucomicrobiota bacterium]
MGFEATQLEERDQRMTGKWRSVLSGGSIKTLSVEQVEQRKELWLYPDGRARWGYPDIEGRFDENTAEAPTRTEWVIKEGRTLMISMPISPMPEYGINEWTEEAIFYDVMMVEWGEMLLNDRPFDGEFITLFERYEELIEVAV